MMAQRVVSLWRCSSGHHVVIHGCPCLKVNTGKRSGASDGTEECGREWLIRIYAIHSFILENTAGYPGL